MEKMDPRVLSLRESGRDLMSSGDCYKAIEVFSEAIQLDQEYPALYSDRGQAYFEIREYKLAVNDFQKAFNGMPSNDFYRKQLKDALKKANIVKRCIFLSMIICAAIGGILGIIAYGGFTVNFFLYAFGLAIIGVGIGSIIGIIIKVTRAVKKG